MLIYGQYKYLNCLMSYSYMLKQYDFINEIHSLGNENCEHIILLTYLIVQQVDPRLLCALKGKPNNIRRLLCALKGKPNNIRRLLCALKGKPNNIRRLLCALKGKLNNIRRLLCALKGKPNNIRRPTGIFQD